MRIGTRRIGGGHPVYFIAEAGSNHDRNLDQALRLIDVAADAGADAVKFQTFRADKLYARGAGMSDYLATPRSIYDIIKDLEMPLEWLPRLATHARDRGLDFLSTPFDEASADALDPFVAAFKIASYEMTHHGLVQHCARKRKPLIVSTGTATLDEVREMIAAVRAVGGNDLVVLQCTAKYPAPLTALNVRAIRTMAAEFGVLVGLSDHSREPAIGPMTATALGAAVIEKHFTIDNSLPGPDHVYALEPDELAEVIRMVRAVERALGDGEKVPQEEERELRAFARRSIFTIAPVGEGERLSVQNCAVLRCGKLPYGMHPARYLRVLGRAARRPLAADAPVGDDDLAPLSLVEGDISLRPLDAADGDRVVAWRRQPEVVAQLFSDEPPTRAQHDAWFQNLQLRSDRLEFVICRDDRPVGTIGLSDIDFGARSAQYGILLGEQDARGQGIAQAASRILSGFAFEVLDLDQLILEMFADNAPARRLYDRLGFVEAEALAPRRKDGVARAVLRMKLDRNTWVQRRTP